MKNVKVLLTVTVISVILSVEGSQALATQSVGGNLNGFAIGKQIGVLHSHPGVTTTSFIEGSPMEPTWQPPDPKDPADQR